MIGRYDRRTTLVVPRLPAAAAPRSRTRPKRCCRPRRRPPAPRRRRRRRPPSRLDRHRSRPLARRHRPLQRRGAALPNDVFAAIECDAVLEHVAAPQPAIEQMERVLAPGGHLHVVVPVQPSVPRIPRRLPALDRRRPAPLPRPLRGRRGRRPHRPDRHAPHLRLEYVKLCAPRPLRRPAYAAAGWVLWPLRYLDVWLNRRPDAHILANSIYALVRKPR